MEAFRAELEQKWPQDAELPETIKALLQSNAEDTPAEVISPDLDEDNLQTSDSEPYVTATEQPETPDPGAIAEDTAEPADAGVTLKGGRGKDILSGTDSSDSLKGGGGKDTLIGHGGDDVLTGGKGADVFHSFLTYNEALLNGTPIYNHDQVTDFEVGVDKIGLLAEHYSHKELTVQTVSTGGELTGLLVQINGHEANNSLTVAFTEHFSTAEFNELVDEAGSLNELLLEVV